MLIIYVEGILAVASCDVVDFTVTFPSLPPLSLCLCVCVDFEVHVLTLCMFSKVWNVVCVESKRLSEQQATCQQRIRL